MRKLTNLIPWITGLCGVCIYLLTLPLSTIDRPRHEQLFALPPKVLRIVSLQFKEVAGDMAYLNALTYAGGLKTQPGTDRFLPEQYEWIYKNLKNSVALDSYFRDPYYLMNSALIWDRYKLTEVNGLIAKGADNCDWDYFLPFYVGFNYYYFLDEYDKSFYYLKEASKRAGGNPFFDSLASRVAYQANKTEFAITYLEQQIYQAEQGGQSSSVESLVRRLQVLQGIRKIEVAVDAYRKQYSKQPESVSVLLSLKLLDSIPKEPNGGSYYLDPDGRVHSTKDLKDTRGKGPVSTRKGASP
jgi:hypothetical protein